MKNLRCYKYITTYPKLSLVHYFNSNFFSCQCMVSKLDFGKAPWQNKYKNHIWLTTGPQSLVSSIISLTPQLLPLKIVSKKKIIRLLKIGQSPKVCLTCVKVTRPGVQKRHNLMLFQIYIQILLSFGLLEYSHEHITKLYCWQKTKLSSFSNKLLS